jgi:hypothetical protein
MKTIEQKLNRLTTMACVGIAASALTIGLATSNATADGRRTVSGLSHSAFPPAFTAYMSGVYGTQWMHTVQEEMIRRIYRSWLAKECGKLEKDRH